MRMTHERTFQTMKWAALFVVLITVGVLLAGCASVPRLKAELEPTVKHVEFVRLTDLWSERMGIDRPDVFFGHLANGWCGVVSVGAGPHLAVVTYDECGHCAAIWRPKQTVLHELCHLRLQHLRANVADKHDEVEMCIQEYEKRERRGDYAE